MSFQNNTLVEFVGIFFIFLNLFIYKEEEEYSRFLMI